MARASINRGQPRPYTVPKAYGETYPAGTKTNDAYLFHGGAVLDFASRLFAVAKTATPYQKNWRLDRGTMVQRPGTSILGPGVNSEIIGLTEFKSSAGVTYQIRVTQTTIDLYNVSTNTWTLATGPAFSVSAGSHAYITSWGNDTVIIQIDTDKMYQLTPSGPTYVLITTTGAGGGTHSTGKQLETFAGRVIVTQADQPYRLAWSTKNDNTNWTGIGSGFEDLLAAPGGNTDYAVGVYSVTDDQALVVRSSSVWLMVTTGIADVPFRFSRIYDKLRCESPMGIAKVPGGIVVPTLDDIYYITPSAILEIGNPIRNRYAFLGNNAANYISTYDERTGEYVLGVIEGNGATVNVVYRYNFFTKGWSRDEYPFPIKLLAYTRYITTGLTIAQLTGTIGNLQGTIGNLGATGTGSTGILMCGKAVGGGSAGYGFVLREDAMQTQDWNATFLTQVDSPTEIWTGIIPDDGGSLLNRDKVNDVQMEYSMPQGSINVSIDFSPDGGQTWTQFGGTNPTLTTNIPDSIRWADTFECEQMMMRIRTANLANLRLNGLHIFTTEGAMSNP